MPLKQEKLFLLLLLAVAIVLGVSFLQKRNMEDVVHLEVLKNLSTKLPISEYSFYSYPSTCRGVKALSHPSVSKETFDNFYHNNNPISSKPRELKPLDNKVYVVSNKDLLRIYKGQAPELHDIPNKLIVLSRVGFNKEKTQAIVCVESEESGDLVYMRKDGKSWMTQKWAYVW